MSYSGSSSSGDYLARRDRVGLCQLLEDLGPDAPTLCAGWTTRDLAAHLVARDRRPDSIPGLVVPALAGWSERVRGGELRRPYQELVAALRDGPPRWSPLRRPAADRAGNTHEFFVHHEDVRRAQPEWEPRLLDARDEADLWRVLGWFAGRAFRQVPVGVVLRRPDGTTRVVRQVGRARRARRGGAATSAGANPADPAAIPTVILTGPPGELLLYAFGRKDQARVELDGEAAAVAQLESAPLSW
jgi:uncharacterized protein (TIGR03085 family)